MVVAVAGTWGRNAIAWKYLTEIQNQRERLLTLDLRTALLPGQNILSHTEFFSEDNKDTF